MFLSEPTDTAGSPAAISLLATLRASNETGGKHPGNDITHNWSSLIGIITAIVGNVLIALALNVQRYAHIQLHQQRAHHRERAKQALKKAANGREGQHGYGTVRHGAGQTQPTNGNRNGRIDENEVDQHEASSESDPLTRNFQRQDSGWSRDSEQADGKTHGEFSTTYLRSPYWWLGQVLITVGEMGNFLAYGFAPASIVSPLGVVALISNCVIAPCFFNERFRQRDFWGVIIAIGGAVTVVLSAKQEETKLEPHDVWAAITTMEFEIYLGVTIALIALLMWASPKYGNRTILIDLGLVGLFGGYTVLATKGVSSMLSSTLWGAFTTPVTYFLILILLGTAIMQVRYVNKALQRFDSTQVIPIQFVMFTLCVIIGSAVLYRDFERSTGEQATKFVGGCLLTFFGVFLITSGRDSSDDDEEMLSDDEDIEETINLHEQPGTPQLPTHSGRRDSNRSRRSSRVGFMESMNKPLTTVLADSGIPTLRMPASRNSLVEGGESPRSGHGFGDNHVHPGPGPHTFSTDSVFTVTSASGSEPVSYPTTPSGHASLQPPFEGLEAPTTPRPSVSSGRPHSQHFQDNIYSPSPLSSTVKAVMADTLLRHIDSPSIRRIVGRRSRPSLRSSLFVPSEDLDEDLEEQQGLLRAQSAGDRLADGTYEEADDPLVSAGESRKGFRGRARSLSSTITGLFAGKRPSRSSSQQRPPAARPSGSMSATAGMSTDTL